MIYLLLYGLGLIDAPHAGALDPAADAAHLDPAPVAGAGADFAGHLRLELGHHLGRVCGRLVQAGRLGGDNEGALAGQQALMDPAACPLPIAYFPPILELGPDLDGHGFALENPVDRVAWAGPGADVYLVGPERGKTRQRQARALPLLGGG